VAVYLVTIQNTSLMVEAEAVDAFVARRIYWKIPCRSFQKTFMLRPAMILNSSTLGTQNLAVSRLEIGSPANGTLIGLFKRWTMRGKTPRTK
jgi:hypothetical protein